MYQFIGLTALAGYIATIPVANWMIGNVGALCIVNGPCVVPVWLWPLLLAPSGSLMVGLALVLRDVVQRAYGPRIALMAIAGGAIVSALISPPAVVVASAVSFLLSELCDFAVYTPLARRRFILAVFLSSVVGLFVDGVLFLSIAFGSLDLLPGIVLAKAWMVLAALPLMVWVRSRLPDRVDHGDPMEHLSRDWDNPRPRSAASDTVVVPRVPRR